ncbi:MAG: hypothetical protein IKF14_13340 [Atopobiaceae bacterium]|nr:hypothetical protein [Atopobiaceae bacterium]
MNVKNAMLPVSMLDQTDAKNFLGFMTGHDCIPCEGEFSRLDGFGSINYYDKSDGLGYILTYGFEECGYGLGRITCHDIERYERNDGMFDVTRDNLTSFLKELARVGYDARTVMYIANHFALDV